MPTDPWADFTAPTAAPRAPTVAPVNRSPQPVFTAPRTAVQDAEEARRNAESGRQNASLGNDMVRTDIAVRGEGRQVANDEFAQTDTLRQRYDAMPEVRAYRAVLPQLLSALRLPRDGTADSALVYTWSKIMDPLGAVREGDVQMASSGASAVESAASRFAKEFNLEGGGNLPDEVRAALIRDMDNKVTELGRSYLNSRQRFTADAEAYGFDPLRVVGAHDSLPFRDDYYRLTGRTPPGSETEPVAAGGGGPQLSPTTPEESIAAWGSLVLDEQGNPIGRDGGYGQNQETGEWGMYGRVTDGANDPTADMGILEGIGESITGNARSTPEIEALPDAMNMPLGEGGGFVETLMTGLGMMTASPEEMAAIIQSRAPGTRVRQDANGNFILTSAINGREYAIKPGFRPTDIPRAAGAVLAFTPAGRATSYGGAVMGSAGTQALIETAQDASGGSFDPGDVALAGASGIGGLAIQRAGSAAAPVVRSILPKARAPSAARQQAARTVAAAERVNARTGANLQPLPADVGGPGIRNATGGAGKMPISASLIGRARDRLTDEAERARDALANLVGPVEGRREAMGEGALAGAQTFIRNSRARVGSLYAKARQLGGDQPVDMANARAVLDEHIAELSNTPGGATGLEGMRALRAELDQPYSVEAVRRMRTQMRDRFIGDGLRGSDLERRMDMVVDAADGDITDSLTAAGLDDAAEAYRQASSAHRERLTVIDTVLAPIIGNKGSAPRSGEQIVSAIEQAGASNSARLASFINALPADDAATLRASLVARLGAPTAGQASEESTFSLARMLTQWNGLSERSKSALFGGELRAAMDDLATVASAARESGRFTNFSNTGSVGGILATSGAIAAAPTNPWSLALLALDGTVGTVLSSPKFTRWLARMPDTAAGAQNHVSRLSRVAASDPVHSAEIISFQQALQRQLEQGAVRGGVGQMPLAAEEQSQTTDTTATRTVRP